MTTSVSYKAKSGETVSGLLGEPAGSGKGPAVVLIQEWWGLNDHMKSLVDRLTKEGFVVVAPDLYHGKITKDAGEAGDLMNKLDTHAAVSEIAGAVAYLKEHARSNGHVAVMGFCMGGALALASGANIPGLSAVAAFYGIPPEEKADLSKITAPVIFNVGKKDGWITPEKAEAVKKKVDAAGKTSVELHVYDADHAFVNDTRPEVYAPEAAKLAWERTVAFLKKHSA